MERLSDKTVKALRRIIINFKDPKDPKARRYFGKKVMLYLIEHSKNLSKKVYINLPGKDEYGWGKQAADIVDNMMSSHCKIFLGQEMDELGIKEAVFSQHQNDYGFTIYLTDKDDLFPAEAEKLKEKPERLLKIGLIA